MSFNYAPKRPTAADKVIINAEREEEMFQKIKEISDESDVYKAMAKSAGIEVAEVPPFEEEPPKPSVFDHLASSVTVPTLGKIWRIVDNGNGTKTVTWTDEDGKEIASQHFPIKTKVNIHSPDGFIAEDFSDLDYAQTNMNSTGIVADTLANEMAALKTEILKELTMGLNKPPQRAVSKKPIPPKGRLVPKKTDISKNVIEEALAEMRGRTRQKKLDELEKLKIVVTPKLTIEQRLNKLRTATKAIVEALKQDKWPDFKTIWQDTSNTPKI